VRVCLDTNVLFAAFATRGLCADVLRVVLEDHELVVGEVLFGEFERALRAKLSLPEAQVAAVLAALVTPDPVPRPRGLDALAVSDPDDAWVVATAVAGRADVLVTGDAALLAAAPVAAAGAPLPLLSPRGFWTWLRGGVHKR
jgi:uncharacterized protein